MKTIFDHLNNMLAIDILHRHNTCIVACWRLTSTKI